MIYVYERLIMRITAIDIIVLAVIFAAICAAVWFGLTNDTVPRQKKERHTHSVCRRQYYLRLHNTGLLCSQLSARIEKAARKRILRM